MYFVMKKVPYRTRPDKAEKKWTSHAQRAFATKLFSCNSTRYSVLKRRSDFRSVMDIVHPSVKPIVSILSDLRDMLVSCYIKVEKNTASIDHTCADGLHEHFSRAFTLISQAKKMQGIELHELDSAQPTAAAEKHNEHKIPSLYNLCTKRASLHEPDAGPSGNAAKDPPQTSKATDRRDENPRPAKRLKQHAAVPTPTHRYNLRPRRNRS